MNTKSIYRSQAGRDEIMALYDRVLAQWPTPSTHLQIPTRFGDTCVIASGDPVAPPLVLLHGSASNSATWMGDVAAYCAHYRVYAVDIPGEPGKSAPVRFSWDGPAFAEWLDDVLNGLGLEVVILGGISLGAWATIKYALHWPERVAAAVLVVPPGIVRPRLTFVVRMIGYSVMGDWGRNRIKQYILQGTEITEEADQFLTLVGQHFRYRTGTPPLFTDEELRNLEMPILYIAGEHDALLDTPKTAARLQALLPNVTVKVYADDGHVTINTAAEVVAFLQGEMFEKIAA